MIEFLPLLAWPPFRRPITILIFHRVLREPDPLRPSEPTTAAFSRLIAFVARHFTVLPLRDAVARLQEDRLPKRTCCITFDDGYADNLTNALPILEKHGLPATVFVATGYLDGGRMFNDTLIDAIAHSEQQLLDLGNLGLGRHSLATVDDRRTAFAAIREQLKFRPPEARESYVAKVLDAAGCGPLPTDIMLTSDQVREMSRRGIEIGGHTVVHPILTSITDDQAMAEISTGKQQLEAITGRPVRAFAYPNGRPQRDYAARHVSMVRELGFDLAVSTARGVCNRNSDIYQLPRFTPWGHSTTMMGVRMMRNAWTRTVATA